MSVNSVQQFLNVRDSHLRVVSGNVHADQMVIGGITVDTSHGLQSVTDTSNVTTNTVEFSNATTAFVTTANATIGGILNVDTPTTLGGDLTVSGNTFYSNNTSINIDSNVIAEFTGPHTRLPKEIPLKKYPEIAFESGKFDGSRTSTDATYDEQYYLQAGTTVKVVSETADRVAHQAFNGNIVGANGNGWHTQFGFDRNTGLYDTSNNRGDTFTDTNGDPHLGMWIQTKFPNKIKVKNINLYIGNNLYRYPKSLVVLGHSSLSSLTGWTLLHTETDISTTTPAVGDTTPTVLNVNADTAFDCYTILVKSARPEGVAGQQSIWVSEIEYYGYEEDPPAGDTSVDTTFTSIMNTPQTTGANVYVDGNLGETFTNRVTGPTPTGTETTYDQTGKYWELTGELTSNVTVEANTFLEGDAPHSVSIWFNSSNLEANVSNTCVFSVSDQEKLDSVNLDLQSNTWHNLTYAYQGEGGSRVTYLDGRKVAEDQAEDTFGDYPPFAMTGYSQGGYVVSSNSEKSGNPAWEAFDSIEYGDANGEGWETDTGTYSTVNDMGAISGETIIDTGGGQHTGHWIKIEFPQRIRIDYARLQAQNSANQPKSYVHLFSNNDQDWDLGYTHTTGDWAQAGADLRKDVINTTKYYKYAMILVKSIRNTGGTCRLHEIGYYGHRENDLVRLPDPTHVLKYPHIALTGPAQRGYVATASSIVNNNNQYGAWGAFNGNVEQGTLEGWGSEFDTYDNASPSLAVTSGSLATQFNSRYGEYINIKLPHKILLSKIHTFPRTGNENPPIVRTNEHPDAGYLYGSNDGFSTFQEIYSFDGVTVSSTYGVPVIHTIPSSHLGVNLIAYDEYRFQITRLKGQNRFVIVSEMELFGTEETTPVPIQIGGGNIDKVANFRVYDKFIDEDQALEIWDAQKDEFGRAKSSMTLQKGRLGLGTEEPEGRLAVLDEPHAPEKEFPPRAGGFDGDEWYIEGHGTFKACASNYHDSTNYYPGRAFTKSLVVNFGYASTSDSGLARWSGNNGLPNQSSSDPVGTFQGHQGDWLELELPYRIRVKSFQIQTRIATNSPGDHPKNGFLYGSNNRENWTEITQFTNLTYTPSQLDGIGAHKAIWNVKSETGFKYLRLLTTQKIDGSDAWLMISELKYFGTREQGQSVLHDGQLTLTKNLDVPRIGPALDADDTPRRDRLVVEYNTSTNPTFEGAVRDTSGRGNDGVFYNSATYNATEKSLDVPNGTGIIRKNINLPGGNIPLSASAWIKGSNWNTTLNDTIVCLGTNSTATGGGSFILRVNTDQMRINFEQTSNYTEFSTTISNGIWYHVVATYDGGTSASARKLFIDGVEIAQTSTTGTITGVNLAANPDLAVGMRTNISGYLDGFISNFKLYDVALTASEVKTLYDMGRCDEGHHVVNFSKTRVGIGLGDGEVSDALLNVGGVPYGAGVRPIFSAYEYDSYTFEALSDSQTNVILGNTFINHNNAYNTSTGVFTVPVTGEYHIFACCQWRGFSSYNQGVKSGSINFVINDVGWNPTSTTRPVVTQTIRYANERKQLNGSLVIKLNKGDQLKVQCTNNLTQNVGDLSWGQGYGRFAAFLLS